MNYLKSFNESRMSTYEKNAMGRLNLFGAEYYKDKPELLEKEINLMKVEFGESVSALDDKIKDKQLEIERLRTQRENKRKEYFRVLRKVKSYNNESTNI